MEPMFVVTTVFISPDLLQPTIHVYGPYTRWKASDERSLILREHADLVTAKQLFVKTNKIIDLGDASFIWSRS